MELGEERYDTHTRKTMSSTVMYSTTRVWKEGKEGVTQRLRRSRKAVERQLATPVELVWEDKQYKLNKAKIAIGRDSSNDIVLGDSDVSGVHCHIVRVGDDFYLEDLNSTNGTFANGGQVSERFRLSVGDVITVGTTMLMAR